MPPPSCVPYVDTLESLAQLSYWQFFSLGAYLLLTTWTWRDTFYQHLKTQLNISFHRFLYHLLMFTLMFFNGFAAWRVYACGGFQPHVAPLIFFILMILSISSIGMAALAFTSIIAAMFLSIMSLAFSIVTTILFALDEFWAGLFASFNIVASAVILGFFSYALYYRNDILRSWKTSQPYYKISQEDEEHEEMDTPTSATLPPPPEGTLE